jgi:F-type H+-transporting ATPase subunit delta
MTLSAVATRYANALADVVTAAGSALRPETALAELRAFESVIGQSHELQLAFDTPAITGSRKKAVVARFVGILKLSPITRNLLFVLIDRRRMSLLSQIVRAFQSALDRHMGVVSAEIASAGEMNEAQRAALAAELEKLTGKRIRMTFAVDDSLIGGAVAKVGATVYDGSVRGSLESLQRRLSAET